MESNEEKILVNFKARRSLVQAMKQAARQMDISYSLFIRLAIKEFIEKRKTKKDTELQ